MEWAWMRRVAGAGAAGAAMLLTGCNGFFVDPNKTTTTTGSSTANYAYVANSDGTVSEFVVGSNTLTAVSGSPFTPASPLSGALSVVVNPANSFVYVGGNGGVVVYAIDGTTGALAEVTSGGVTEASVNYVALKVSPNGEWLLALDNINNQVWSFPINTSTGVLSAGNAYRVTVPSGVIATARDLAISPNGALVGVALGVGGDDIFTFDETSGALSTASTSQVLPTSGFIDDSVAFDKTSAYLLVGRGITATGTSSILSFAVSPVGVLGTSSSIASGEDPYALLLDATGAYLYSANKGDGTVSGYTIASGSLTALAGSPFKSETGVIALAEDINSKYVLAVSTGGTADLTLYALDALVTGQLDAVATSTNGSGATGSVAVAMTHPQ